MHGWGGSSNPYAFWLLPRMTLSGPTSAMRANLSARTMHVREHAQVF
jgi:hypothetical protein